MVRCLECLVLSWDFLFGLRMEGILVKSDDEEGKKEKLLDMLELILLYFFWSLYFDRQSKRCCL